MSQADTPTNDGGAQLWEEPRIATWRQPVSGRDGVHVRTHTDGAREWQVRHAAEGIAYSVREMPGCVQSAELAALSPRQHVIIDRGAERHGAAYIRTLERRGVAHHIYPLAGGERCKTVANWARLCDDIHHNASRRDLVTVIGGGAACDVARCAASWVYKGMPLLLVPTTATAYKDASIGVKGALNSAEAKNVGGVYYGALLTALDLGLLAGCDANVHRAGLIEALKMAVIEGGDHFTRWLDGAADALANEYQSESGLTLTRDAIETMLVRLQPNLREHILARLVDLGHFLVSLLELRAGLLHGMAVGIDLALCAEYAAVVNPANAGTRDAIHDALRLIDAPLWHPILAPDTVTGAVEATRRHRGGAVNLPVPEGIGNVQVHEQVELAAVSEAVRRLSRHAA